MVFQRLLQVRPAVVNAAAVVVSLPWLAACGSLPAPELPRQVPAAWRGSTAPADSQSGQAGPSNASTPGLPAPDLQSWWTIFDDPVLDALVDQALRQNLSVAQAASRLRQARLLARRDRSQHRPTLNGVVQTVQDVAAIDSYFHAGLDATWELGLFGARESVERGGAARLDLAAAGEQGARVTAVAEVVRRYLDLQAARHDEALLQRMLAIDERLLALHGVRVQQRLGSMDERRAIELRLAQTRVLLAPPRAAAAQARQALAVLLGQTEPDAAWEAAAVAVARLPASFRLQQLPADLLRFRPDIRAAEAEVDRASSELGSARAELYPRVTLGLSFLFAYNITQNRRNVNDNVPAFGPMIDIPLFDWGRRRAAADAREEALNAALLAYRQSVVEGVGDTEAALALLALAHEREDQLALVERHARSGLQLQGERMRLGLASQLDRLEAERSGLQAMLELGAAGSARAQAFVLLYKSLGGAPLAQATGAAAGAGAGAGDGVAAMAATAESVGRAP